MTVNEQDFINMEEEDPIQANRSRSSNKAAASTAAAASPSNSDSPSHMTFLEMENSMDQGLGGRQGPISAFHKFEDDDAKAMARHFPSTLSDIPNSNGNQFSVYKGHADFDDSPKICK